MKYVKILKDGLPIWGSLKGNEIKLLKNPPFEKTEYTGESVAFSGAKLLAPCEASKVVAIGKNYFDHVSEMKEEMPENPIIFLKPATAIINPGDDIIYPKASERVDYEGELALIIKKRAYKVKRGNAAEYILGYTCLNDVTARDIQKREGQWDRAKGYDTFAPLGPIVTNEAEPYPLEIETRLNGAVKQKASTSLQMWKIPELIEFITDGMTLLPGDVVTTGTPSGIGPMQPGDTVEIDIPGVGILKNTIIKE